MIPGPVPLNHQYINLNGLLFHYVEAGTGPVVVLIHGFPEFWYSWRHQIPALAAAGFHVVALDLRGYNESAKPAGVRHYRLDTVVDDVVALIGHLGNGRAVIVGHDWGGVIAWLLAMRHPEIVDRLVVLNAPHPAAFRREMRHPAQWFRSAYILLFQLPWLPEWLLRLGDFALLERVFLRQPVHAGAFTPEDIRLYKQALSRAGALTAALNYYRAAGRSLGKAVVDIRPIQTPTLLIWGELDPYLGVRLLQELGTWVPILRIERLVDASHWVQNDVPDAVNRLILDFLQARLPTHLS